MSLVWNIYSLYPSLYSIGLYSTSVTFPLIFADVHLYLAIPLCHSHVLSNSHILSCCNLYILMCMVLSHDSHLLYNIYTLPWKLVLSPSYYHSSYLKSLFLSCYCYHLSYLKNLCLSCYCYHSPYLSNPCLSHSVLVLDNLRHSSFVSLHSTPIWNIVPLSFYHF